MFPVRPSLRRRRREYLLRSDPVSGRGSTGPSRRTSSRRASLSVCFWKRAIETAIIRRAGSEQFTARMPKGSFCCNATNEAVPALPIGFEDLEGWRSRSAIRSNVRCSCRFFYGRIRPARPRWRPALAIDANQHASMFIFILLIPRRGVPMLQRRYDVMLAADHTRAPNAFASPPQQVGAQP